MRRKERQSSVRIRDQNAFNEAFKGFRFHAEHLIYRELLDRAIRYEELRAQLKKELSRYKTISRAVKDKTEVAHAQESAQPAIADAAAALQDMPRAVSLLLLQNPLVYESIQRAGGMRGWMRLHSTDEDHDRPLPALLMLIEKALQNLRDPLILE